MMELGVMGTGRWMMEWGWIDERKMDDGVGGQVIVLGLVWGEQGGDPNLTKMGTPVSES